MALRRIRDKRNRIAPLRRRALRVYTVPMSTRASHTAGQDHVLAGISLMLTGIFVFALNDALGKWLVATYAVGQLLLLRGAAGMVCLLPFLRGGAWRQFRDAPRPGVQLLRPLFATRRSPASIGRWRTCRSPT